jgi:hypothetical protein
LSAISASASLLVGGADDGTLLFWDRVTGNLRASFHDTHPEAVTQVTHPGMHPGFLLWDPCMALHTPMTAEQLRGIF